MPRSSSRHCLWFLSILPNHSGGLYSGSLQFLGLRILQSLNPRNPRLGMHSLAYTLGGYSLGGHSVSTHGFGSGYVLSRIEMCWLHRRGIERCRLGPPTNEDASSSTQQLKDVGFSAHALKEAGFSALHGHPDQGCWLESPTIKGCWLQRPLIR